MLRGLASAVDRLNEWIGRGTWYMTLAMVLVGAYTAVMRFLSNLAYTKAGAEGAFDRVLLLIGETALRLSSNTVIELQWYLFSLVFLLGAAYTLKHDAHVRVDVFYSRLSMRSKAWINIVGTVLFLIPFCVLMCWMSWSTVVDSWVRLEGSPDPGGLPRYPLLTVIPVAFLLLMLQGVAILIREITTLRGQGAPPSVV